MVSQLQGRYIKLVVNGDRQQDVNGQGDRCCTSCSLAVVIGWQRQMGDGGGSQIVKVSGLDGSSQSTSYASYFPYPPPVMEATRQHTNPWNINMIFMDWMCYSMGRMARVDNRACTTMQSL